MSSALPASMPTVERRCISLSCVVPAFNELGNLRRLIPELRAVMAGMCTRWEIIVVDDGSSDGSTDALIAEKLPGVRVVELSRNFGKEAALTAGLEIARGTVVISLDADLQHPPSLIPVLMDEWRKGADIVYALRTSRQEESLMKRLGAWGFYRMLGRADRYVIPPGAGDFRLLDRKVVDALLQLPERSRMMKGLYAWVGFRSTAVPYTPAPRGEGRSHYNYRRLASLSLAGITSFTTWPLRLLSATGFLVSTLALIYGVYLVVDYVRYGNDVAGWTTLSVTLLVSLGMQLMALGLVGEYIGRIFEEVKRRPLYLTRRVVGPELEGHGGGDFNGGGTPRHD